MNYQIYQAKVEDWARDYDGPPFHALLCDPPYHLTSIVKRFGKGDVYARASDSLLHLLESGLCRAMAATTKGFEIREVIGLQVGNKQAKRDFMMHLERLVKLFKTLLCTHSAILAGPFIPPFCLSFLGLPVWAISMLGDPIDILGMIFPTSMLITASTGAILTSTFMSLFFTCGKSKHSSTIQTGKRWTLRLPPSFIGFVLALWRTVFPSSVLQSANYLSKVLAARLASQLYLSGSMPFIDR